MSTSNLKMIVETMKMIEGGPIDATTEKYLKKMAKYAAKIQETRNLLQHKLERDFQSKEEEDPSQSTWIESKTNADGTETSYDLRRQAREESKEEKEEESDQEESEEEEIIYGDSDDDTPNICAITSTNIIEGKRVRRSVQKYQDPDYEKIVLKDIPEDEIEAALFASDVEADEDEDEDEDVENNLERNRGQFWAENEHGPHDDGQSDSDYEWGADENVDSDE
jgi:hypothetical protein